MRSSVQTRVDPDFRFSKRQPELGGPPLRAAQPTDRIAQRRAAGRLELESARPVVPAAEKLLELGAHALLGPARRVAGLALGVRQPESLRPQTRAAEPRHLGRAALTTGSLKVAVGRPLRRALQELLELATDPRLRPLGL